MARLEGAYEQIDRRFAELRGDLDGRFAQIDGRFAQIEGRFVQIDGRFVQIDGRFEQMDRRFVQIDQKFTWIFGLIAGTWSTTILTILFHR